MSWTDPSIDGAWNWSDETATLCADIMASLGQFSMITSFLSDYEPVNEEPFKCHSLLSAQFANYCEYVSNLLGYEKRIAPPPGIPVPRELRPNMRLDIVERCGKIFFLKGLSIAMERLNIPITQSQTFLESTAISILSAETDCSYPLCFIILRACFLVQFSQDIPQFLITEAEWTPTSILDELTASDMKILKGSLCTSKRFLIRLALSIAKSSSVVFDSRANDRMQFSVTEIMPIESAAKYFYSLARTHMIKSLPDIIEIPLIYLLLST